MLQRNDKADHFKDVIDEDYAVQSQLLLPFLPTPRQLIRKILHTIHLPPGSLLYDLGSGDGRVIEIAVSEFKLKACGFEINKPLYEQSLKLLSNLSKSFKKNAKIYRKDLFELDLKKADAVFIFGTKKSYQFLKHILKTCKKNSIIIFIRFEPHFDVLESLGFSFVEKVEEHLKTHDIFLEEMVKDVYDKISADEAKKPEIIDIAAWILRKA